MFHDHLGLPQSKIEQKSQGTWSLVMFFSDHPAIFHHQTTGLFVPESYTTSLSWTHFYPSVAFPPWSRCMARWGNLTRKQTGLYPDTDCVVVMIFSTTLGLSMSVSRKLQQNQVCLCLRGLWGRWVQWVKRVPPLRCTAFTSKILWERRLDIGLSW